LVTKLVKYFLEMGLPEQAERIVARMEITDILLVLAVGVGVVFALRLFRGG
jgi:hypothetical protein